MDNRHLLLRCTFEDDYLRLLLHEQLLVKGNIGRVLQVALRTSQLTNATAAYACVKLDLLKDKPSRVWIGMGSAAPTAEVPDLHTRHRWTPKNKSFRDDPSGIQGQAFVRPTGKEQGLVAEGLPGDARFDLPDLVVPSPRRVASGGAGTAAAPSSDLASSPPAQGNFALLGQNPHICGNLSILGADDPHPRRGTGTSPIPSPAGACLNQDAQTLHPPEASFLPNAAVVLGSKEGRPVMLGLLSSKVDPIIQAAQDEVEPNVVNIQISKESSILLYLTIDLPATREEAITCEATTLPVSTQVLVKQDEQVEQFLSGRAAAAGDSHNAVKVVSPLSFAQVVRQSPKSTIIQTKLVNGECSNTLSSSSSSGGRKIISHPSRKGGVRISLPTARERSPSPVRQLEVINAPDPTPGTNITDWRMKFTSVAELARAENIFMSNFKFDSEVIEIDSEEDDMKRCSRRPGLRPRTVLRRTHSWDRSSMEF
ncbi:hypothetical protein Taro_031869 [Colocasia esculenta]|uniref:Uncharacterized protein n=1 Tax=Colocasia esculenta TaxID=4460 RepID=A0A843VR58_COLES|nr:hypothetical protein [Colocasia esculenta]